MWFCWRVFEYCIFRAMVYPTFLFLSFFPLPYHGLNFLVKVDSSFLVNAGEISTCGCMLAIDIFGQCFVAINVSSIQLTIL